MKIILPILLILISIVVFIFGVNPWYKDVTALKADILVYNKALSSSTELQKTEDSLITSYNEIKQVDKDRLSNFLPNSVNNIQFILEIERIASLHNMPVKNIKFESVKKDATPTNANTIISEDTAAQKEYGVFPIEFTTEGTYASFLPFLKDLEYNLRLADVKSVSFTVPDQSIKAVAGVDPNVYQYILKVETYWLK
jgi:hypothetical protein